MTYISPSRRGSCSRCGNAIGITRTSSAHPTCRECQRANPKPRKRGEGATILWACGWCGKSCERKPTRGQRPKWCSPTCGAMAWTFAHAQVNDFQVRPSHRRELYERDGYTCQICGEPTSREFTHDDPRSPTLDHIEPQSAALVPDHSDRNLRTAHWVCNAVRGNGRLSDADVATRVLARFAA